MSTKSIFRSIVFEGKQEAERLVSALEQSEEMVKNEEAKHKKKSSKKGKKRADHKHEYEEVLVANCFGLDSILPGKRCKICGYIRDVKWFTTLPTENPHIVRLVSNAGAEEAYLGLKIYDYNTGIEVEKQNNEQTKEAVDI